jgi:DNA-binding GntR family transcriptional regulator
MPTGRTALRGPKPKTPLSGEAKAKPQKGWMHKDAVTALREMILSGELEPGEQLREVTLAQRLGMSRTPVREAFRTLAAEGLVRRLPHRSVVVAELDESESIDVFAVLGTLEALAGQLACERMTAEQMELLEQLQADLERHFEAMDRASYTQTNRAIHELMVEASQNSSLILVWRLTVPRAERARTINTLDRERWAAALEQHRGIFAALTNRDAPLLSRLMQDHFAQGVIERISQSQNRPRVRVRARSAGAA